MSAIPSLFLGGLLSIHGIINSPRELKDDKRPDVPALSALKCFDTPLAWIYCDDAAEAKDVARQIDEASQRFKQYFDAVPKKGAIIVGTMAPKAAQQITKAGADWMLPWVSGKMLDDGTTAKSDEVLGFEKAIADQIREQLKAHDPDVKVSEDRVNAMVQKAIAQMHGGDSPSPRPSRDEPLTHELGHLWFARHFYPNVKHGEGGPQTDGPHRGGSQSGGPKPSGHYGSPAPDWLDEAAAILMENEKLTAQRRKHLVEDNKAGLLVPLSKLFTMAHPGMSNERIQKAIREARAKRKKSPNGEAGQPQVIRLQRSDGEVDESMKVAAAFYTQCRGLLDFIQATTGDDRVVLDIAKTIAGGKTIDEWLKTNGAAHHLPATVDDLDKAWQTWIQAKTHPPMKRPSKE